MRNFFPSAAVASLFLAACGQSSEEAAQQAAEAEASAAEEARLALQAQCLQRAAQSFNDSRSKTANGMYSALTATSLENCPSDLVADYGALVANVQAVANLETSVIAIRNEEDSAFGAGALVTIGELLTSTSTGLTPYSNYLRERSDLEAAFNKSILDLKAADTKLRATFAGHGYIDERMTSKAESDFSAEDAAEEEAMAE